MAEVEKGKPVSLQELMVSTLAMTDALSKLLMRRASSQTLSLNRSCMRSVRSISESLIPRHSDYRVHRNVTLAKGYSVRARV
jgi:hypothetical protein